MPWSKSNYPNSLKHLPSLVRNKAIEIANALLVEGQLANEGIIIATATSRAKDWAVNRGTIQKKNGRIENRISYNPRNTGKK
jgi:uncharacterized protein YdaT